MNSVVIIVKYPPQAETEKSWKVFTSKSKTNDTAWSNTCWFPKKICILETLPKSGHAKLTIPEWLFKTLKDQFKLNPNVTFYNPDKSKKG